MTDTEPLMNVVKSVALITLVDGDGAIGIALPVTMGKKVQVCNMRRNCHYRHGFSPLLQLGKNVCHIFPPIVRCWSQYLRVPLLQQQTAPPAGGP